MNILIGCESSGTIRDAFIAQGHNAISCDLLPTQKPGPHLRCDLLDVINDGFDAMIAHPTCTYMTNSGVTWYDNEKIGGAPRWAELDAATIFFRRLWQAPIRFICLENPIMHKYAKQRIGVEESQIIQPWMFGHTEQKATCLWLKSLPLLKPTNEVKKEMLCHPKSHVNRIHHLPPSETRWQERSLTFSGIATAMAMQWGEYIVKELNKK